MKIQFPEEDERSRNVNADVHVDLMMPRIAGRRTQLLRQIAARDSRLPSNRMKKLLTGNRKPQRFQGEGIKVCAQQRAEDHNSQVQRTFAGLVAKSRNPDNILFIDGTVLFKSSLRSGMQIYRTIRHRSRVAESQGVCSGSQTAFGGYGAVTSWQVIPACESLPGGSVADKECAFNSLNSGIMDGR